MANRRQSIAREVSQSQAIMQAIQTDRPRRVIIAGYLPLYKRPIGTNLGQLLTAAQRKQ